MKMKTEIGINDENRQKVADELSKLLADEVILYTKTRNAHWNVEGDDFYNMHTFFEEQYNQLNDVIDEIAERCRAIGHYAPASLKDYLALTHLTENTRLSNNSQGFIEELLTDHQQIIVILRENVNRFATHFHDVGSSDFITGLMKMHEKTAWMLRAHIK